MLPDLSDVEVRVAADVRARLEAVPGAWTSFQSFPALYQRVRASGASVISIAHRPAVLKHHTHVLELRGDGAWALHAASDFVFDR